jgi:thiol peroxidase
MSRSVTLKGRPLSLEGPELAIGMEAPSFCLHQKTPEGLRDVTLDDFAGKVLVLCSVPSLDTTVCAKEAVACNAIARALPESVQVLFVSTDLPFAQERFCNREELTNIRTASDHRDVSFGRAYGVLIPELRILSRAVFVVGLDRRLLYVEYLPELTEEPDYEAVFTAAKSSLVT